MNVLSTPMRLFMCGGIVATALALAACGAANLAPPGPETDGFLQRSATMNEEKTATVVVPIAWTNATKTDVAHREPRFVSPSASSAIVTVRNGASKAVAFANKGTSKESRIRLQAPVGNDDMTIALYDQPQNTTTGKPLGKLLGEVSLVQTVVAGTVNVVRVAANGVVHSVTVAPAANQPFLETAGRGYAIVGQHRAIFVVTPRDADGNAIVPPGIKPSLSLQGGPSNAYFAVLPSDDSRFTVVVTTQAPPNAKPVFIARATDAQDTTVSKQFVIEQRPEVFVAYGSGNVLAFDDQGTVLTLPSNAFMHLGHPVSIAYDDNDQTLFVADAQTGLVDAFTSDGAPRRGYTAPSLPGVTGVAWDSQIFMDEIIAVAPGSGIIASSRTGGAEGDTAVISPFPVATPATGVAYMPPTTTSTDQLLVSDAPNDQLDLYSPYGAAAIFPPTSIPVGPPTGVPGAIAVDSAATVAWVSGTISGSGELWRLPLHASSPPATALSDGNAPAGVAYDVNLDRLFVAESSTGVVAAYKSDLSAIDPTIVLRAPASVAASNPQGVAVAY